MITLTDNNKTKIMKVLIILGIILSVFGILTKIYEITIYDFLKKETEEYMLNAYNESKTLFLTLSVIKATMGVIEGSTVNANAVIGVNIELGDIIEPVYDMINILWKTSLISVVILKIETMYFNFFSVKLMTLLLSSSLILTAPFVFFKNKLTKMFLAAGKYLFYTFLFIYLLIPTVLFVTSRTVSMIEEKHKVPAIKRIEQNVQNLNASAENLFRLDESTSIFNIKGQADSYKEKVNIFKEESINVTSTVSEDVPLIIGITVFGYIILPILITLFLYKMGRSVFLSKLKIKEF